MTTLGDDGPLLVVGGGPTGSLLSILLAQRGHRVRLLESRSDLRTTDISAGRSINLALTQRGIAALEQVGVMDRVREITIPMYGRMVHDSTGGQNLQPYGTADEDAIYSVSRTDLNGILLDAAEATGQVELVFRQRCRGVDFAQRQALVTNDAGEELHVPFGTIFGADGVNSVVRRAMLEVNQGSCVEEILDHGYKELTVPPNADGSFKMEPEALHIWPRGNYMLIALPNPDGDFTVTLFMPMRGSESFESLTTAAEVDAFFQKRFPTFVGLLPDLAADFFDGPTGELGTIRCVGWNHEDAGVLLGDAAHGIVPFHGQGMNAGMESALVLSRYLDESPDDVAGAFAAFEAERKPDGDAIADMALGNYVEMRSGVVDPDYLIKRELEMELERRHPDLFRPRYAMVTFTAIRYSEAQARAQAQGEVLTQLTDGIDSIDEVDWTRAAQLVEALGPLPAG